MLTILYGPFRPEMALFGPIRSDGPIVGWALFACGNLGKPGLAALRYYDVTTKSDQLAKCAIYNRFRANGTYQHMSMVLHLLICPQRIIFPLMTPAIGSPWARMSVSAHAHNLLICLYRWSGYTVQTYQNNIHLFALPARTVFTTNNHMHALLKVLQIIYFYLFYYKRLQIGIFVIIKSRIKATSYPCRRWSGDLPKSRRFLINYLGFLHDNYTKCKLSVKL